MSIFNQISQPLPQNAEFRIRLRWQRGLLGLPMLAPTVVVGNRAATTGF